MPQFPRRPYSTRVARRLRSAMTPEELALWRMLRRGFPEKFRRQEPIGRYVVDFVCYEFRLVVEVDGSQHASSADDARRDQDLSALGFRVLRIPNADVIRTPGDVADAIADALGAGDTPRRHAVTRGTRRPRSESETPRIRDRGP